MYARKGRGEVAVPASLRTPYQIHVVLVSE